MKSKAGVVFLAVVFLAVAGAGVAWAQFSVSGSAINSKTGLGAEGVRVVLWDSDGADAASSVIGEDGGFDLDPLREGDYGLCLETEAAGYNPPGEGWDEHGCKAVAISNNTPVFDAGVVVLTPMDSTDPTLAANFSFWPEKLVYKCGRVWAYWGRYLLTPYAYGAIFSTQEVDLYKVDLGSLRIRSASAEVDPWAWICRDRIYLGRGHYIWVNKIAMFIPDVNRLGLPVGPNELKVVGQMKDGRLLEGRDSVTVYTYR